jgi:hypothetical protein
MFNPFTEVAEGDLMDAVVIGIGARNYPADRRRCSLRPFSLGMADWLS